jgi:hypothetical protein
MNFLALLAGLVFVVVSSTLGDVFCHWRGILPPHGRGMNSDHALIALGYRCVFQVMGSYLTARMAPEAPLFHSLVLNGVGTIISGVAAIAILRSNSASMGPRWYPVALTLSALPCGYVATLLPGLPSLTKLE